MSDKVEDRPWKSRDIHGEKAEKETKKINGEREVGLGVITPLYTQHQVKHETEKSPVPG